MRTTFAVGRVDRKTSQLVLVASVARAITMRSGSIPSAHSIPAGPWSLRALVEGRPERAH